MTAALDDPTPGEDPVVTRVRALSDEVVDALAEHGSPPIPADDIALVLRFSVRSTEDFPRTPLAMKQQVHAEPPPVPAVTSVDYYSAYDLDVVKGTWEAPDWRLTGQWHLDRDASGLPLIKSRRPVEFVLAIPNRPAATPAPITMHQHGNPGDANAVINEAGEYLADAGFAVIGFTDNLVREVGYDRAAQDQFVFTQLIVSRKLPELWMETLGEQLSFLRLVAELGELDFVPYGNPDGQPDLDVTKPLTYVGISEGSNKGQALMPYAPEIRAGALVVGAMRGGELFFALDALAPVGSGFLDFINVLVPNIRPMDLWVGFSLFQLAFDPRDPQNHAAFMYADPVEVRGTTEKPSVLVQEGVGDTSTHATRGLAQTLGPVPVLEPIWQAVPYLPIATPPITDNIELAPRTTSGLAQYVPDGFPGIPPTPGCIGITNAHVCGQASRYSRHQRVRFLQTAVEDAAPTIVNPFEELLP